MAELGRLQISNDGRRAILNLDNEATLNLYLGESFPNHANGVNVADETIEVLFGEASTKLVVTRESKSHLEFYHFAWFTPENAHYLKDTVYLGGSEWFGGPQLLQQAWPIQNTGKKGYDFSPYVVADTFQRPASGLERFWISSEKVALVIPATVPLWTQLSDNSYLALQAQYNDSPYVNFPHRTIDEPYLQYTLVIPRAFESVNLPDFYTAVSNKYLDHPHAVFDEKLIEKPIWTTWARYGKGVTQADVTNFADEIVSRGFPVSQIELDDKWTSEYGDFEIDTNKFPDFPTLVAHLKSNDIRLSAWVHPFVNTNSKNAANSELRDLFVKGPHGHPETVRWWNGEAFVIDVTNPDAYEWFKSQLTALQDLGIFTFKFDAGELNFLPDRLKLSTGNSPNDYPRIYTQLAAEFGTAVETRVGGGVQTAPILLRTIDRKSQWSDAGLQTVIPSVLHYSLLGYYWNLPDLIGGNGYNLENVGGDGPVRTDSELFIRWVQANAFLLVLQFSFAPWDYQESDKVVEITKSVLKQRDAFVPYIKSQCRVAIANGVPVIRPLWWALSSKEALTVDDEFLVGDRLLVAPVVRENTYQRNVILPEGQWRDDRGEIHQGPTTIIDTDVPIDRIPYYWRLDVSATTWLESLSGIYSALYLHLRKNPYASQLAVA
uniref:Gal_mutarotas_2 domain-containing protein n=1 Tax=Panagrellus redivivus TaxID=6233 RepID=A0A7E4VCA7_PANRE